jgi:hypothetical protein
MCVIPQLKDDAATTTERRETGQFRRSEASRTGAVQSRRQRLAHASDEYRSLNHGSAEFE